MTLSDDARRNLERNAELWSSRERWEGELRFGETWSGATHCRTVAELYLIPFLPRRASGRDETPLDELDILEIAPGAGRFTIELLRWARRLVGIDASQSCVDLCRERFRFNANATFHVNDGVSLDAAEDDAFDLIASWDSFVHMDREIIAAYVARFPSKLRHGGIAWIHHSARGESPHGWRSNMTSGLMADYAEQNGLLLKAQCFRSLVEEPLPHFIDCISVLEKP